MILLNVLRNLSAHDGCPKIEKEKTVKNIF